VVAPGQWRSVCAFSRRTDWAAWAGGREPFPLVALADALTPLGQSLYLPYRAAAAADAAGGGARGWGPFPPGFAYLRRPDAGPGSLPLPKWADPPAARGPGHEDDDPPGSWPHTVECAAVLVSHRLGWGLRVLEGVPRGHLLFEYAGRAAPGPGPPGGGGTHVVRVEHDAAGNPLERPWHVDASAEGNLARLLRRADGSDDAALADRGFRRLSPSSALAQLGAGADSGAGGAGLGSGSGSGSVVPPSPDKTTLVGNVVGRVVRLDDGSARIGCYARCSIPAGDVLSWSHSLAPDDLPLASDAEEERVLRDVFGLDPMGRVLRDVPQDPPAHPTGGGHNNNPPLLDQGGDQGGGLLDDDGSPF